MKHKIPTSRQLETELSQQIRNVYLEKIDFKPQKITCKLFSKYLAIVGDNAITPVEANLWQSGDRELVRQIRKEIDDSFKPQLSKLIADILNVEVVGLLIETAFETDRSIVLAILSESPQVRNYRVKLSNDEWQKRLPNIED
jgi:uncharacterized protein YbcI